MSLVNDPNYCHYHQIANHLIEKCFILKDLIMKLAKQWIIHLNLDEIVESNHDTVTFGSFDLIPLHVPLKKLGACASTIQCESSKPKQTQVSCRDSLLRLCSDNKSMSYDEEGWTFVTRKRLCKNKCLIHTLTFLRGDDMSGILVNIWRRKKKRILKENKWLIIQIEDLLVQKLITLITIGEYFPLGFFGGGINSYGLLLGDFKRRGIKWRWGKHS